jgi:hypothetical protein
MAFFPKAIQDVSLLVMAAYLFIAMRQVYGDSRKRTAVKLAAAMATYVFSLVFASLVVRAGVFLIG